MRSRRRNSDLRLGSPGAPRSGRSRGRYPAGTLTQPGSLRTRPARRRATHALPALFTLAILGAVLVAAGWWFANLPVSAVVAATPTDARITSLETSATGTLALDEIAPGAHTITVERAGFEPLETTIEVLRFGENSFRFDLIPLPQRLAVSVEHSSAVCRVIDGDGAEVASAEGALETTLPAGAYTVEVSAPGCNTRVTELFLDGPVDMRVWPDAEGQLVECIGHIACAGAPKGVHVTPDGREAWATILNGPPSIEIFDLATMQRSGTVELGAHGAVEIIFTRDGSRAYASQMETAKVFEIDTATRAILRELPTESAWTKVVALSPDESTLYAANWSGNDVSEIDLDTGSVRRRIRTASTPRGLWPTPDGRSLYVAGFGGGELQRIDLASGSVTTVFDSDGALRHLVGDADRGVLYVSDMARDCVWVHDLQSGETSRFIDTDAKPNTIALSPDGAVLFVSCRGANNPKSYYIPGPEWGTILLYDAKTGSPLDAIVGGNQCTALDISADGATLVFSDFLDDRLRAYRVPAHNELTAGNGGRWEQHYADLRK